MIPATAILQSRPTFGTYGFHQPRAVRDIAGQMGAPGTKYSILTPNGFKMITKLNAVGVEQAYIMTLSILGKRVDYLALESMMFPDFNTGVIRPLLELECGKSGLLYNTSVDMRCNGTHLKLQVAEVLEIERKDYEVAAYEIEVQSATGKFYVDSVEVAWKLN